MNTQKQIIVIIALFFLTIGACAGYAVIELPYRTGLQSEWHFSESVERGALLYANNCRTCHGNAGEGFVGPQLNKDDFQDQDPLKLAANRDLLTRTLVCGRAGTQMPAWLNSNGGALNERQIEHLVNFLPAPDEEGVLDENGVPTSTGWVEAVHFAHNLNHEVTILVGGDNLVSIALDHGIGVQQLADLNGITDVNAFLEEQTTIDLPAVQGAPNGGTYKITTARESVHSIADRAFVGAAILADYNGLEYELDYEELTFQLLDGGSPVPGLVTGQLLALPDGVTYSVTSGETIESVAELHGITPEELIAANPSLEGADVTADLAPADDEGNVPEVVLNLPPINGYVTRGQSWNEVADAYGNVTGFSLAEANNSETNVSLRVSQGLSLPPDSYGGSPPDTINTGTACIQYAVPNSIYDQISGGGSLTPSAPFEGVVEALNIAFTQTQITLPPDTEVKITLDNQDAQIPHNIQFFNSPTAGEGGFLKGCTAGCAGDADDVVSELINGIAQTEITFITPAVGEYSFDCVVHPNMVGTLIIEEGAEVPEASQP